MSDLNALLERADRAVADVPLPAGGLEGLERYRDRKRRNQRITAGVVGIVVFVAAVWVVTTGGSFNRMQQPAVQPTPTPPARTIPGVDYLFDLNTSEMTQLPNGIAGSGSGYAVSPDGTMVAYTSVVGARLTTSGDMIPGRPQVFTANLDFTDVQQVTHDQRGASAPAWSPDGKAIAYMSGDYTSGDGDHSDIFVLDLATGQTSQVTREKPTTGAVFFPQFSPDGASIIYEVDRGDGFSVRLVPVTGGRSVLLVGGGRNDVEAWVGTFSPDGSTLAVGCSGRLEGICIAHADGTNLRTLVSGSSATYPKWSPDGTRIAYTDANTNANRVFVVDVATGETSFVAEGALEGWLDDHTLILNAT
jgi:Tol biopolymer transport system component